MSTLTVSLAELATMMSGLPSPFKSATASEYGLCSDREDLLGQECAVALAEEHADGVVVVVGDDQVRDAVAAHIGDHHRHVDFGRPANVCCTLKLPSPLPRRTLTELPSELVVTRSAGHRR